MTPETPFVADRPVECRRCSQVQEFLDLLRPSGAHWCEPGKLSPWVFRGQGNANWGLVPKAWRPGAWDHAPTLLERAEPAVARAMRYLTVLRHLSEEVRNRHRVALRLGFVERYAVKEFASLADELGFPVPSGPYLDVMRDWAQAFFGQFKSFDLAAGLPDPAAVALAQHHGVPTRLLDFTRQPLVAAFFAAKFALESATETTPSEDRDATDLAVWALCPPDSMLKRSGPIHVLTVPRHQMTFLHAQHGLFIYDTDGYDLFTSWGKWPDLAARIGEVFGGLSQPVLRKITLPRTEAEPLMRRLWTERISLAHLMPTFDSITASLKGSWLWPD